MQKRLALVLMIILAVGAYSCTENGKDDGKLTPDERCEYLGLCDDGQLTPEEKCQYLGLCDEIIDPDPTCEQACTEVDKVICTDGAMRKCTKINDTCNAYVETIKCANGCQLDACFVSDPDPLCAQRCTAVGTMVCTDGAMRQCTKISATCNSYVEKNKCALGCDQNACKVVIPDPVCAEPCTEIGKMVCTGGAMKQCNKISATCNTYVEQTRCPLGCDQNNCREALPECELTNNSSATIVSVTDGDTAWVMVKGDKCAQKKHKIRLHGIDAPECYKERNTYYYYVCVINAAFDDDNELYGYEASVAANSIMRRNISLKITCDYPGQDGVCPFDNTDARYLAYISLQYDGKEIDFSTEMARQGMAFSGTNFASNKRAQICRAQNEAIANRAGIWSQGEDALAVVAKLGSSKRKWVKKSLSTCAGY